MICIYLSTNSDLCHLQHKLTSFYNRDEKCLLRGTDWVFKKDRYSFVLKGLMANSVIQICENVFKDCEPEDSLICVETCSPT